MIRMNRSIVLIAALALAGCGRSSTSHDATPALSERQRDSIISRSDYLPGSRVVGRAMLESDKASARAAKMDTLDIP